MISIPRIVKLSQAGEFERTLEEALRSGRSLPLRVRLRLLEPGVVGAAALGLGLRRIIDLTYKPTDATASMLTLLLAQQREDGSFGAPAPTAIAAAALDAARRQIDSLAGFRGGTEHIPDSLRAHLDVSIGLAGAALARMTATFGGRLGDRLRAGAFDPIDAAIVLWQIADSTRLAGAIGADQLLDAAERAGLFHDRAAAPLLERFTSIRPVGRTSSNEAPLWNARTHADHSSAAAA